MRHLSRGSRIARRLLVLGVLGGLVVLGIWAVGRQQRAKTVRYRPMP